MPSQPTAAEIEDLLHSDGEFVSRRLFFDRDLYALELERVFGRVWLLLGHESQIPEAGDFFLSSMGEESVIVTRTRTGEIAAFLNTCPHRGMAVCRADRGRATGGFTCPYHGWTFGIDGALKGTPRQRESYPDGLDRSTLGLTPVAKVETWAGLVFGCLDAGAISLDDYLGDMRFYLETSLCRRAGGLEVFGLQKWRVKSNWKLPAENQAGDVAHGPASHRSVFDMGGPDAMKPMNAVLDLGRNVALPHGHGLTVRVYPEDDLEGRLPGEDGMRVAPGVADYYRSVQAEAEARLGSFRSRLKIATANVFPSFSLLGSNFTIRVAHPRGPMRSEVWSWVFVDRDAPEEIKTTIRRFYTLTFGPGGIFEQDDGENWEGVTAGAAHRYARDRYFHYGMGLGKEGPDEELPGIVGSTLSEHTQRSMYRHWQSLMLEA